MELKPCPFCGAELEFEQHIFRRANNKKVYEYYRHPVVDCILDGIEIGDEQEAAMWNRRADNG